MEIIVRTDDKIRIRNGSVDHKIFADVNSNNQQYGFDVTFYQMHKLILIEKERTFKMFVMPHNSLLDEYDFGWWEDGEVVWQSF